MFNRDPAKGDLLIVGLLGELSLGNNDNVSLGSLSAAGVVKPHGREVVDDPDSDGNNDLDGLHWMGQQLHQFDVLEHLFDDVAGNTEWEDKDFEHDNKDTKDAAQENNASDAELSVRGFGGVNRQ